MNPQSNDTPPDEQIIFSEKLSQMWSWDTVIVEGIEETIFSLDRDWHFAYLNNRAAHLWGRSKEALLGKIMWEEFPTLLGSNFEKLYREAMETNIPGILEDYSPTVDAWYEVRAYPIPQGLIVYFQDITERKHLEQALRESEARYKTLSEGASEGVIIYQNEIIIEANEAAVQLCGYASAIDLLGMPLDKLISLESLPQVLRYLAEGYEGFFEFIGLKKDSSQFPIEGRLRAIEYRGQSAWVVVVRDITERKLSDEALHRYTRRLEVLHEIDKGLIEASSIPAVVKTALENIRQLIPCRLVGITMSDQAIGEMVVFNSDAAYAREVDEGVRIKLPPGWFDLFDGFNPQNIRLIEDIRVLQDIHPRYQQFIKDGLVSALQVLLVSKDGPLGLLALLADTSNFFNTEYQEIATQIGSQLTIALQQLRLSEQAARHATELEQMVTSLEQAEEQVRQSELRYRSVVDDQTDLICRYDNDFKLTFVNRAYLQAVGKPAEELLGKSFLDKIPREDRQRAVAHVKALNRDNPVAISEHHAIMSGSEPRWFEWTDRAILTEDGAVAEYQGVGRDITDHKNLQVEQARSTRALEDMRQFLQTTLDVLPSHIAVLGTDGTVTSVNAAWIRFGQENGAAPNTTDIGTNYLKVCANANGPFSEEAAEALKGIQAVISGQLDEYYLEYPCHSPTVKRWFGMNVNPFNEPTPRRVVMAHTNITERRLAEDAVRQSEEKYRSLIESSDSVITMVDVNGEVLFANKIASQRFQLSPTEFVGKHMREFLTSDESLNRRPFIQQVITKGTGIVTELPMVIKGETRWYRSSFQPVLDTAGKPYAVMINSTDITSNKKAEEVLQIAHDQLEQRVIERTSELERVKTRLEAIFNSSSDGILLLELEKGIQETNIAFDRLFKRVPGSAIGLPLTALVQPQDRSKLEAVIQEVAQTRIPLHIEFQAICQDGTSFEAEISLSPMNFSENKVSGLVCIVRDVSERKRAEEMIAEERNLLRTLIDAIPDFIYIKDTQHRMVLNNAAHARSLAIRISEQAAGKTDFELFPAELAAKFHADEIELFRTGQPILNTEERTLSQDRSNIWALTTKVPLKNLQGEVIGLVGITHDVSKIKEQEERLQRNQADLESIIESTSMAFVLFDLEGTIRVVNHLAQEYNQKYFGVFLEAGHTMLEYLPQVGHPIFLERFAGVKSGENITFLNKIKYDNRDVYFEFRYYPVKTASGEIIGINLAYEDITSRKENELQLRYLASLQENMLEAVIATDLEFNIKSWNKAAEHIYGWTAAEVIGKPLREILPTRVVSSVTTEESVRILREKGFWSGETVQVRRDGSELNILSSVVLFKDIEGNPSGIVGVNHDITDRKKAEAVLEEKRAKDQEFQQYLKALHEISVELTSISSLDEFYKRVVELGLARLGFERLGFLRYDAGQKSGVGTYGTDPEGKLIAEHNLRVAPEDLTGILHQAMLFPDQYIFEKDTRLYANGEFIGRGWNAAVGLWQGTEFLGWLTIDNAVQHKVITREKLEMLSLYRTTVAAQLANKLVEEKLQATSQRLELATHTGGIGIWDLNLANDSLVWDDQMLDLYGIKREDFSGTNLTFQKAVHPDDWNRVRDEITAAIDRKKPFDTEFRIFLPNGTLRHIKSNAIIVRDENDKPIREIGVNWDITNLKRSEEALFKALKKEKELSELKSSFVSRASHEFRTPLAAILATTETLSVYRPKMSEAQIDVRLDKIRQQIMFLKDIMEDVLQLSRIQSGKLEFRPSQGNMEELCQNIISEFEGQEETKNRIVYNGTSSPLISNFDSRLIRQVISNLMSNALKYSSAEKSVYLNLSEDNLQIILKVRDEGIGIPAEDIKSLFEPFNRASNVGTIPGTGLGLSIALEAVEMHGGTILVESQLNVGSTFTITLPKPGINTDEDM